MLKAPLAIYIHWPFCKSKCPYCDFNSHVREGVDEARWQAMLLKELETQAQWLLDREVKSIFFGGGTPSLMPPQIAASLIEAVHRHWKIDGEIEITLEANPTSVEAARFAGFRSAGVNRVSLGVQSLRAEALHFLGREHSAGEALDAVALAAKHFPRYSFDLIYARPGQTREEWMQELEEALPYAHGHLSLYQLTIEEGTAFFHAVKTGHFIMPEDELCADMFEDTQARMEQAGMPAYEISNHAALDQESLHNLAYWRGHEYLGIGPGAHGRVEREAGKREATQMLKSPERWLEAVARDGHGLEQTQPLSAQERYEEKVMMGMRLAGGLPIAQVQHLRPEKWKQLQQQGLLEQSATHLRPTLRGKLLLNTLTAELLS